MGKGTDAARAAGAGLHADVIDDFKDQLLLVLIKRLAGADGSLVLPVAEIDNTGNDLLAFRIVDGAFYFQLERKQ